MKKAYRLFAFLLTLSTVITAQQKEITLEEIWDGTFRQERLQSLQSLNNGTEYVVLNRDRESGNSTIDVYSYKTGEKTNTLVNSANLQEVENFSGFEFSENENKIILATNLESIFRRSTRGIYYVYDVQSKSVQKISEDQIQEPTLSPGNDKVAYVFENNIYIKDLTSGNVTQVTSDGKKNEIINGVTDWVYEEEFSIVRAFDWNKTGNKIAFLKFDESEVPEFSMDIYGQDLYQTQNRFKYPKAGEANSDVSLHLYDVASGETNDVQLAEYEYIPRLQWTNESDVLSVQTLNRHQNNLNLIFINATNREANVILNEVDEAYVDVTDNLTFLDDNSFIWTSEQDGWNHIYHYNRSGKLKNQITEGQWEVTNYYGYDPGSKRIFYQSTENGSINRDVYSIRPNGRSKQRLTEGTGNNSADFSADFTYFINAFTNATTPTQYTLHLAKNGKLVREIEDNAALAQQVEEYGFSPKEFSTINVNGNDLNMWMVRPSDFDETKEYPLFMFQYSGPGSQSVANTFYNTNDYWFQLLANEGYIVVAVDPRGTGLKGADFKKVTQKELGKYEVEDIIQSAKQLGERSYIDADRIGIWGWSYGGFMSSNAILKGNDTFKMAIAVAPVTSWRFYDSIYTERYMTTPQENPSGYDENSPINHVEKLKGAYLLVHGTGDDNVHVQNSMRMIEALVQANKQFDWAIYPDKNHGIYGGNTRLHLYTLMTNFIKENL
ncbi:peptidase S9 [Salinimicrobium marinum]|uniref:Peptidase S9 n=1 Tax=Salinimicrobium marinum TaxID=680283 RepID=A0A918W0J5_9FLAO|nr:S9 family peptidase [Salinimicrobium marinum]GHA42810.1 peptidase S9 [Salinimicrobium marinum]